RVGEKTTTGGLAPKALKKLNGARLTRPSTSTLVTQAMGRGVTTPTSRRYTSSTGVAATSTSMAAPARSGPVVGSRALLVERDPLHLPVAAHADGRQLKAV